MNGIVRLGSLLADARLRAGMSQHQLAVAARTSQPAIARLERGRANPTLGTVERVLAAVGLKLQCEVVPLETPDPVALGAELQPATAARRARE